MLHVLVDVFYLPAVEFKERNFPYCKHRKGKSCRLETDEQLKGDR
jgi:hypothetical protein